MLTKKGITLIELLIALLLLTSGATALIYLLSVGMFADTDLSQSITALNLANEKMEEIKDTAFANISSGSETGRSIGFGLFDSRTVSVTDTETDLKDVTVEVSWTQKGSQRSVAVETYIADY